MLGDVASLLGGCLLGRDLCADMVRHYGGDTVRSAIKRIGAQSERSAREIIRERQGAAAAEAQRLASACGGRDSAA